ncbi:MAG: phosphatidate cytidylyltransferase [Lachnospiraceae bacterium]|nr:phosphatidate cytidylyltransferase [Lachnospiraceae bacterium]
MFRVRLISGIVLLFIVAVMNAFGGPVMDVLLLFISLTGLVEFYRATGVCGKDDKGINVFSVMGIAGTVVYFLVGYLSAASNMNSLMLVIVAVIIFMMGAYVFAFPKYDGMTAMKAFFGFIYVPFMLHFIYMTRTLENGEYMVWLIYIASWGCDTSAYCIGKIFGKHRLAPVLSPKKSIEGAIGGVAGTALFAFLYSALLVSKKTADQNITLIIVFICSLGAVVSQIGDLTASAFKRNNDIKDYGNLIPGHGGILDRFDSVIFVSPIIYLLSGFLIKIM